MKDFLFATQLRLCENKLDFGSFFAIVNQEVGTFTIFLFIPVKVIVKSRDGAAKTFSFNTVDTEEGNQGVIKLQPFVLFCFNKGNVMSRFCVSNMNDNSCKFVIIISEIFGMLLRRLQVLLRRFLKLLGRLLMVKMLECILVNVELHWEFVFRGYFLVYKSI